MVQIDKGKALKILGTLAVIGGAYQLYRMYNSVSIDKIFEQVSSPNNQPDANVAAFLSTIRYAEGATYNTLFGGGQFSNMADHPYITGEWKGKRLSDRMCINSGHSPGCISTAAGAYQVIVGTWRQFKLENSDWKDFSPASQDKFALWMLRKKGALNDVRNGNFDVAINKVSGVWASLPGSKAKQNPKSLAAVQYWYKSVGGQFA